MKTLSNYPKIMLGVANEEKIYLSPPSWDCGWYWGFGYLGNNNCHYHVDGLGKNTNLYDGFKNHFTSLIIRDSQLWTICELFETFYALKNIAEVYNRGGAHYTSNRAQDLIKNPEECRRINEIVLPQIFEEIYKILIPSQNNYQVDKELLKLILKGDSNKVVDFMMEYKIKPDDLKNIAGVSQHDFSVIHSYYYDRINKKRS